MYTRKDEITTGFILWFLSLILTGVILYWLLSNPQNFIKNGLGIHPDAFRQPFVWILTFIITINYILYTVKVVPFVRQHLFTFSWLKVVGIWAALVSSTVEEIVFRKFLMDWLMELNFSVIVQVLASAIIFGVAHGAWVLLSGELKIALPVILSTTVLGGLLAVLYLVADRNIFAPIVAHILINLFIEPWLILAAVSKKWKHNVEGNV